MGFHAQFPNIVPSNSSENEINSELSDILSSPPQPGKYFLATGKDFPFCRKFDYFRVFYRVFSPTPL